MVAGSVARPEFSYPVRLDVIGSAEITHNLSANAEERAALSARFDLASLDVLSAKLSMYRDDQGIRVRGSLSAELAQICVATGDPVLAKFDLPVDLMFVEEPDAPADGEIELAEDECDLLFHDGKAVDLGEAVAQSLGLALDPYPKAPSADAVLRAAGVKSEDEIKAETGPFAALATLKSKRD